MRLVLNTKAALVGGFLAGVGASACCVGPLLLLSVGIGGAWISHLTALEPFRPLFIVLTGVLLGLTFWRLYLVRQSCATSDGCAVDRTRKVQRILFWIVTPITLGLVASPWILPLLYR